MLKRDTAQFLLARGVTPAFEVNLGNRGWWRRGNLAECAQRCSLQLNRLHVLSASCRPRITCGSGQRTDADIQ